VTTTETPTRLVTVGEAANLLGITGAEVMRHEREGRLTAHWTGWKRRYLRADIAELASRIARE
jgi:excisionase family DNA binding protein